MKLSRLLYCLFLVLLVASCQKQHFADELPDKSGGTTGTDTTVVCTDTAGITVAQAQILYAAGSDQPVKLSAYIVGDVAGTNLTAQARFGPPFERSTNLLLADRPDETRTDYVLPVRLASGTKARSALSLSDHPALWHTRVIIRGRLETYFGVCGIREVTGYQLSGAYPDHQTSSLAVSAQSQLVAGGR